MGLGFKKFIKDKVKDPSKKPLDFVSKKIKNEHEGKWNDNLKWATKRIETLTKSLKKHGVGIEDGSEVAILMEHAVIYRSIINEDQNSHDWQDFYKSYDEYLKLSSPEKFHSDDLLFFLDLGLFDFMYKLLPYDKNASKGGKKIWRDCNYSDVPNTLNVLLEHDFFEKKITNFEKYSKGFLKKHPEISEIIDSIYNSKFNHELQTSLHSAYYDEGETSMPYMGEYGLREWLHGGLEWEDKEKEIEKEFAIEMAREENNDKYFPKFFVEYEKFWKDYKNLVKLAMSEFLITHSLLNLILITNFRDMEKQSHHKMVEKISKSSMSKNDCIREFLEIHPDNWEKKISILESAFEKNSISYDDAEYEVEAYMESVRQSRFKESLLGDTPDYEIENLDVMGGIEFEEFLSKLFTKMGYLSDVTQSSGDQGADLIIEKHGKKTVVQAKRYSDNVSNSAIQEAVAALKHYDCDNAMVVTTSNFTKGAKELAKSNNVQLIDRVKLKKLLEKHPIPNQDFDDDSEIDIDVDIEDENPSSKSTNYDGKDLSNKSLDGKNLSNCDLSKTKLPDIVENAKFKGAIFSGAKINTAFQNCDFSKADLSNCTGSMCDWYACEFVGANLKEANFKECEFTESDFSGANMSDTNLREVNLENVNLSEAILENANLRGASLDEANLKGANLENANLKGAGLSEAVLENANLKGADLSDADLSEADLKGSDLSGANLKGADLSDADLKDTNFNGAILTDADLSGTELDNDEDNDEDDEDDDDGLDFLRSK